MVYKKVDFGDTIDIKEHKGEGIEGKYLGFKEVDTNFGTSFLYKFQKPNGDQFSVWGFTSLDSFMENVSIDDQCRLTYTGQAEQKNKYGKYTHLCLVEIDDGGEKAEVDKQADGGVVTDVPEDEIPFSQPDNEIAQDTVTKTDEIDIKAIGRAGAEELERMNINFDAELKALPNKTWTSINALCKRKMGVSDYLSFFSVGEYGKPESDKYDPEIQAKICKELIAVCRARE